MESTAHSNETQANVALNSASSDLHDTTRTYTAEPHRNQAGGEIRVGGPASSTPPRLFTYVAVFFVAFLLISNIGATKLIGWNIGPVHLVFDGGAILFPLTYIIGDLLSEVYGFARARRVIVTGFVTQILASFCFWLVQIAPANAGWENQAAFEAVLGVVPRFVAASVLGFLFGQLLNSYVLVWVKHRFGERHLWVRLISSTVVGELLDTAIFCSVAWGADVVAGNQAVGTIVNLGLTGWAYKVGVEVVLLPITYAVVAAVKRAEVRA